MAHNGRARLAVVNAAMDPLISALIAKLPPPGSPFPGAANWLRMMEMALADAYDVEVGLISGSRAAASVDAVLAASFPPQAAHAGHDFYVEHDGTVCNADGAPVLITDVPADATIFDCRPIAGDFRDLTSIVWADGARGGDGIAPGVSFCGPGVRNA